LKRFGSRFEHDGRERQDSMGNPFVPAAPSLRAMIFESVRFRDDGMAEQVC